MIQCEYFNRDIHARCTEVAKRLIVLSNLVYHPEHECNFVGTAFCMVVCQFHALVVADQGEMKEVLYPVVMECAIPGALSDKGDYDGEPDTESKSC